MVVEIAVPHDEKALPEPRANFIEGTTAARVNGLKDGLYLSTLPLLLDELLLLKGDFKPRLKSLPLLSTTNPRPRSS